MIPYIRTATATLSVILLWIGGAAAQTPVQSWQYLDEHHRNDCRLAHQILTLGQPANKRTWALAQISGCGSLGAEALTTQLRSHRVDAAWSQQLDDIVLVASELTDRAVFEAGLQLLGDASAGSAARVQAARIVYHQLNPGLFQDYETFLARAAPLSGREISLGAVSSHHPLVGEPLPTDAYTRVITAMQRLIADPGTPAIVRQAADRVLGTAEAKMRLQRVCGVGADRWDPECRRKLEAAEAAIRP